MANKGGRPAHPKHVLKLSGTYREDRHANRGGEAPKGKPTMPEDMPDEAQWLWEYVCQHCADFVDIGDGPDLRVMCETWAAWREAAKAVQDDPIDQGNRLAFTNYSAQFHRMAGAFGMTPSDRAKLPAVQQEEETAEAKFLA